MSRSLKKGPYVDEKLENKLVSMGGSKKKKVLKTWSRRSIITPNFVYYSLLFVFLLGLFSYLKKDRINA